MKQNRLWSVLLCMCVLFALTGCDKDKTKEIADKNQKIETNDMRQKLLQTEEPVQKEEWQSIRYCFDELNNWEHLSFVHPQTGEKIAGQIRTFELVITQNAKKEDIVKLAMALCQREADYELEDVELLKESEEDIELWFIGMQMDIYQYGEIIADNVILLLDKDKKYLEVFQPDKAGSKEGRFITLDEFAEKLEIMEEE